MVSVIVRVRGRGRDGGEEEQEEDVVVAVLDVDGTVENGFDEVDKDGLGRLAALLARCCDWDIAISNWERKDSGKWIGRGKGETISRRGSWGKFKRGNGSRLF